MLPYTGDRQGELTASLDAAAQLVSDPLTDPERVQHAAEQVPGRRGGGGRRR